MGHLILLCLSPQKTRGSMGALSCIFRCDNHLMEGEGVGLFVRTHLSHKSTQVYDAARVAICNATDSWNQQPRVPAGRSEGRLQLRSRCVLEKSAMPSLLNFTTGEGEGVGLLVRTHLSHKSTQVYDAARVAICNATDSWNQQPRVPAGRSEGRLQRRSRCVLEKSAMPSLLNFATGEGEGVGSFFYHLFVMDNTCP